MITGGVGFIGPNLAQALIARGERVILVDDLSRGSLDTVRDLLRHRLITFIHADCADAQVLANALEEMPHKITDVWHLAANSDIPAGVADPRIDLHRTFLTTFGILEVMRNAAIPRLHFASSSAIYGDFGERRIHEDIGPLAPISNYGAMKLASEAQISAATESFLGRADIFRFPNVVGVPATHGVIWDFVRKLRDTPETLHVLGNGSQQKAYLHVDDLIAAMLHIAGLDGQNQVYNIGPTDDGVTVKFIAETVRDRVAPDAEIVFGEGDRGWVGDVPRFRYSTDRLRSTGWSPRRSSQQTIVRAVDEIAFQELGR